MQVGGQRHAAAMSQLPLSMGKIVFFHAGTIWRTNLSSELADIEAHNQDLRQ
jgi:hypothetical protein